MFQWRSQDLENAAGTQHVKKSFWHSTTKIQVSAKRRLEAASAEDFEYSVPWYIQILLLLDVGNFVVHAAQTVLIFSHVGFEVATFGFVLCKIRLFTF